jgi:hypothetical protein
MGFNPKSPLTSIATSFKVKTAVRSKTKETIHITMGEDQKSQGTTSLTESPQIKPMSFGLKADVIKIRQNGLKKNKLLKNKPFASRKVDMAKWNDNGEPITYITSQVPQIIKSPTNKVPILGLPIFTYGD